MRHKVGKIVDPIEIGIIKKEIEAIKKNYLLFENKAYSVFCAPSSDIPNILLEIGRFKEITFREVGKGTNRSMNLNEFDLYYHQLII